MPKIYRMFLGLGANVCGRWGAPQQALDRAVAELAALEQVEVLGVSGLWRSAPFGILRQPPFLNAVVMVRTALAPHGMLQQLVMLERAAGRLRGVDWGARALDIDLLAADRSDGSGIVARPVGMGRGARGRSAHRWQRRGLVLPHPGLVERSFVLLPLVEVAPDWRHPLLGATASTLLARLHGRAVAACQPLKPVEKAMCSHFGAVGAQEWRGY